MNYFVKYLFNIFVVMVKLHENRPFFEHWGFYVKLRVNTALVEVVAWKAVSYILLHQHQALNVILQ